MALGLMLDISVIVIFFYRFLAHCAGDVIPVLPVDNTQ